MKKIMVTILLLALSFMVKEAFANNTGCGFGTAIFKGKKGKLYEILAVTTNGTSGSSTFAITSGTSGYEKGSAIGMSSVDFYIAENMDGLASDIAKGDGEYLDTLAQMMKVKDKAAFKEKLHKNFKYIFPGKDVTSNQVSMKIRELQKD